MKQQIWIIDFGSQYTQLITRRVREIGHSSVVITLDDFKKKIEKVRPMGLILSGGPNSIYEDKEDYSFIFSMKDRPPILGICYGFHLIGQNFKGKVVRGDQSEYGPGYISSQHFLDNVEDAKVWMSHGDHLEVLPVGFELLYRGSKGKIAGMVNEKEKIMAFQFHPEVNHTENGVRYLKLFLDKFCQLEKDWNQKTLLQSAIECFKDLKKGPILCAFSGGVDSLVAAELAERYSKRKVYCIFVDNGLLRPQDYHHIEMLKEKSDLNIDVCDAKEVFLKELRGVDSPEKKRKIIGRVFIESFEKEVKKLEEEMGETFDTLLQGTLYPDVIESVSHHAKGGKSVTIKSHHNVGGLPENLSLSLCEPLKFFFKDEVRLLGEEMGLNKSWLYRHPFPGPGIGVRVLGALEERSIKIVQESDQILFEELKNNNYYDDVWQAFTVYLPVKTVGVKGDGRAYENVVAIRMVNSVDGMTAMASDLPLSFLSKVANRITNEVKGVTRVVYDVTSKPPGTIEWE